MSTQSIGNSSYSSLYALLNNSSTDVASSQSAKTGSENTSWKTQIKNQIDGYLKDVPKGADGKLSFKDVEDYRKTLEKEWDESVMADLEALGVNIDDEFPLSYNQTTEKLTVADGHPDKEIIDQYFELHTEKIDEFINIIQLGKLTSLSQSNLSPTEMQKSLQQQAVSWWYADNTDPSTWFSGGGLVFGQGQSLYTSLDIQV